MIVRDEAAMLPGLLDSVRGVVDQLVVVDTGSVDHTRVIARAAGAVVVDHPWDGHFAEARNAALPHVRAEWMLLLDADERLAPGAGAALHAAIADGQFDLGLLPLSNASRFDASPAEVLSGAARLGEVSHLPRLFRVDPTLRWEGRIHESPLSWVTGKRMAFVDAPIIHLGRVQELVREREKGKRNLSLLLQRVGEEPDEPVTYAYLVTDLYAAGQLDQARRYEEQGWEVVTRHCADPGNRRPPRIVPLAGVRAQRQLGDRDFKGAAETLATGRRYGGEHPNFDWIEGCLVLAQHKEGQPADLERGVRLLQGTLASKGAVFGDTLYSGIFGVATELPLAQLLFLHGEVGEALQRFDRLLAAGQGGVEARLGRVDCLIAMGRLHEARAALQPLAQVLERSSTDLRDVAALRARIDGGLGLDPGPALAAATSPGGRWLGPHRRL
jgi:hypothetical protein